MVVHFPLALIVTAALCLALSRHNGVRRHAAALATVGSWNLIIGACALLPALATGLGAAIQVHLGAAAHMALTAHVKSAILTTLLVLGAALWRGVGIPPDSRPTRPFVVLLWAAALALIVTGYRGGQNVYRYGIGVDQVAEEQKKAP